MCRWFSSFKDGQTPVEDGNIHPHAEQLKMLKLCEISSRIASHYP